MRARKSASQEKGGIREERGAEKKIVKSNNK